MYNADAGVRTHFAVGKAIDFHVRCNLRDMFMDDTFALTVNDAQRTEILSQCREAIGQDLPPFILANRISRQRNIDPRHVTAIIKQGIWRRELRVDLFRPVLMDRPMHAEIRDVLDVYADWFAR